MAAALIFNLVSDMMSNPSTTIRPVVHRIPLMMMVVIPLLLSPMMMMTKILLNLIYVMIIEFWGINGIPPTSAHSTSFVAATTT
jgi:hypothetical protein